jgi:hypothetical protein
MGVHATNTLRSNDRDDARNPKPEKYKNKTVNHPIILGWFVLPSINSLSL